MKLRRRTSSGSSRREFATSSIMRSMARLVGPWPNARTASCTVLLERTAIAWYCTLLILYGPTMAPIGLPRWKGERPALVLFLLCVCFFFVCLFLLLLLA